MEIVLDKVKPENNVRKIIKDSTNTCKAKKSIKVISACEYPYNLCELLFYCLRYIHKIIYDSLFSCFAFFARLTSSGQSRHSQT